MDLSQRDVLLDFGATRAFSSEPVTIILETRYTPGLDADNEFLVRTFIQPGKGDWFTNIDLDAGLRGLRLVGSAQSHPETSMLNTVGGSS